MLLGRPIWLLQSCQSNTCHLPFWGATPVNNLIHIILAKVESNSPRRKDSAPKTQRPNHLKSHLRSNITQKEEKSSPIFEGEVSNSFYSSTHSTTYRFGDSIGFNQSNFPFLKFLHFFDPSTFDESDFPLLNCFSSLHLVKKF